MPNQLVAGLQVHYEIEGTGPQCIIFVHGFRNSTESWQPVRDRLDGQTFTACFVDLPGCGRSDAPVSWERCTIESYAGVVDELCATLGMTNPVVVGHSLGGAIAIRLALDHAHLPRALVLVAPASTRGFDFVADGADEALINATPEEARRFARAAFHVPPDEDAFEELMAAVLAARHAHIEGAVRSMRDFHVLDALAKITAPTLIVAGDRDRHVPIRSTLTTAAAIPRALVHIFHNVGHVPFVEVPDQFTALLDEFVLRDLPDAEQKRATIER
jgi:sigma-B regulation protein RsbQ